MLNNKIFYQHIPKTGGQTLATRIASAFPIEKSSIMGVDLNYPEGRDNLEELFVKYDFVERHVNGRVLNDLKDTDILLTVRNPVKQIVSNYLHILREPTSPLYRPAKLLAPNVFIKQFGDLLADSQTRYFISAYCDLFPDLDRKISWMSKLLSCIDLVRWYVPTEFIDDFCLLWQLETGRSMFQPEIRINEAEEISVSKSELELIVTGMPELYSLDLLFWQISRQRYEIYRRIVLARQSKIIDNDNWGKAWTEGPNLICLRRGWWPPQMVTNGNFAWWAGPERLSEIQVKRDNYHRYLIFSIIVYCGIYENNILLVASNGRVLSSIFHRISDAEVIYVVNIDCLANEELIYLRVPDVWSPIVVNAESTDISRKSVATCNWRLSTNSPFEIIEKNIPIENVPNFHAGEGHGKSST